MASWLLPRHLLPHFYAIYAYCRWADDLADEIGQPGESLRLLDWWESQLDRCYAGQAEHPVFIALLPTIEEFSIPKEPFERLLTAFRQDQRVTRYATAEDVLAYCQNSANPVGRLVLYVGRCHDEERGELSDSICTGLQLTNFCQDVARDWARGRIYLPRATLDQAGYTDAMFARREFNEAFRRAMREEVDRAEHYLRARRAAGRTNAGRIAGRHCAVRRRRLEHSERDSRTGLQRVAQAPASFSHETAWAY